MPHPTAEPTRRPGTGLLVSSRLYYQFSWAELNNDTVLEDRIDALTREIGERGRAGSGSFDSSGTASLSALQSQAANATDFEDTLSDRQVGVQPADLSCLSGTGNEPSDQLVKLFQNSSLKYDNLVEKMMLLVAENAVLAERNWQSVFEKRCLSMATLGIAVVLLISNYTRLTKYIRP